MGLTPHQFMPMLGVHKRVNKERRKKRVALLI